MKVLCVFLVAVSAAAAAPAPEDNPDRFMYNEGMLGGDIAGGYDLVTDAEGRTSIIPNSYYQFWTGGRIYYEIHSSLAGSRNQILEAMEEYHQNTCIRFIERNGDPSIGSYILIRGDLSGCWSYMGMYTQGPQEVSLQQNGCVYKGIIMHELMHAAGFWHEHQRYDRDDYLQILWNNIQSGTESNFAKAELNIDALNIDNSPFDIDSIMHYELTAFSSNGQPTIQTIGPIAGQDPGYVWQQNFFSPGDISELNAAYGCK